MCFTFEEETGWSPDIGSWHRSGGVEFFGSEAEVDVRAKQSGRSEMFSAEYGSLMDCAGPPYPAIP